MTPLVDYWLKANLFLLLFYGCYALLLRRHTFLTLNRTYLLATLAGALLLPLVHIPGLTFPWPWETTDVPVDAAVSTDAITVVGLANEAEAPLLPEWPVLAGWAFALVAAGLLFRTAWRTVSLLRLIRQWPAQPFADYTLVLPATAQTPTFSFFRYLVLNPDDAHTEAVRQHELVHIRQKHSVDVLLVEVIQAFCWLNPALFGYRQAIRQVHEYLADRDATPQTPTYRDAYARFLVNYAFHLPTDGLAHSFGPDRPDSPTLKQRIQMLYQQHTNRRALWKYALVLPLAIALLAMTSVPETAPESVPERTPIAEPTTEFSQKRPDETPVDSTNPVHVQGVVYDRTGTYPAVKPLPGASIVVRNGRQGTTTDAKGAFTIDVPAGTELVASFVGFESQSMAVPTVAGGKDVLLVFKLQPTDINGTTMPVAQTPQSLTVPTPGKSPSTVDDEVFSVVESNPEFPGGTNAMTVFIANNLRYPARAVRANIQGKVLLNFIVNTDGSISQIKIIKGIQFGCDDEAIRIVEQMPKWIPGRQNGRPVAVRYNLPINFSLGDKVGMTQPSSSDKRVGHSPMDSAVKNSPRIYRNGKVVVINPSRLFDSLTFYPNEHFRLRQFNLSDELHSPLYLLDDKEINREDMNALNPQIIQSIDVIKDASAISIYGEKGRKGVVRITTKKASKPEKKKDR